MFKPVFLSVAALCREPGDTGLLPAVSFSVIAYVKSMYSDGRPGA